MELLGVNGQLLEFGLVQAQNRGVHLREEALDGAFVDGRVEPIYVPAPDITLAILEVLVGCTGPLKERRTDTPERHRF